MGLHIPHDGSLLQRSDATSDETLLSILYILQKKRNSHPEVALPDENRARYPSFVNPRYYFCHQDVVVEARRVVFKPFEIDHFAFDDDANRGWNGREQDGWLGVS